MTETGKAKDRSAATGRGGKNSGRPTRSLLRGLAVLEALAQAGRALGPTELAGMVKLDKGTVSRFLNTLQEAGYVQRGPAAGTYTLSSKVLRLSNAFAQHLDLRAIARPHLLRLVDRVHETVHLGIREGDRVVYVDKIEPDRSVRLVSAVGSTMPLHSTALGKAILSRYPHAVRDELLDAMVLEKRTSHTITSKSKLRAALEETKARGYATDDRENEETVSCVAAPILGHSGEVLGAISISSPTFRVHEKIEDFGALCKKTAEEISRETGGVDDLTLRDEPQI